MDEQTGAPTPTQTPPVINEGPQTLAQLIKAQHPEYAHIPDPTLEAVAIAHNPEYAQLPRTHVSPQEAIAAMKTANEASGANPKPTNLMDAAKETAGTIASDVGAMIPGMAHAVMHPIDTLMSNVDASRGQAAQAVASARQGHPLEAVGHAGAFPVVGPPAAAAGEELGRSGDLPRAVGHAVSLIGSVAAPELVKPVGAAVEAAGRTGAGSAVADALATRGGEQIAKAISPVRGGGVPQFAKMANNIGKSLATDPTLSGITTPGFHSNVTAELDKATTALDTAADTRLVGKTIYGQPIVQSLKDKLYNLTQAHPNAFAGQVGGETVDLPSSLARARASQLQAGISAIEKLGPNIDYAELQKIRNDFDHTAKIGVYVTKPADAVTASTNKGAALGAADVAGDVREALGNANPVTARANARYSMLRRADDVLEAQKIAEQTRPTVGRRMLAAGMGAMGGGTVGAIVLPLVDVALRSGPSAQLIAGRTLGQMAQMIRTGDTAGLQSLMGKLQKAGFAGTAGNQSQ